MRRAPDPGLLLPKLSGLTLQPLKSASITNDFSRDVVHGRGEIIDLEDERLRIGDEAFDFSYVYVVCVDERVNAQCGCLKIIDIDGQARDQRRIVRPLAQLGNYSLFRRGTFLGVAPVRLGERLFDYPLCVRARIL